MTRHRSRLLALLPCLTLGVGLGCTPRGPQATTPDAEPSPPANPLTLAVFDPDALDRGDPPPPLPASPIEVLDYGPEGRTEGGGDLHIRFNQAIAALELSGEDLEGLVVIDPPTAGRTFWRTPDLLVFTPEDHWDPAQRYTVRLGKALTTADGSQRFDEPLEWTFETPRPTVTQGDLITHDISRRHRRTGYYIVFDAPVSLAQARRHIRAKAHKRGDDEMDRDDGLELASDVSGPSSAVALSVRRVTPKVAKRYKLEDALWGLQPDRTFLVTPKKLWPGASTITVEVTPGLMSEAGPLPLETPWSRSFGTYGPQKIIDQSCGDGELCPLEPITLNLRNPITERQLKKLSISPKPHNLEIQLVDAWNDEDGGREVMIHGMFIPGKTYKIRLAGGIRDIYGQALGSAKTISTTIDRAPTIGLSAGNATLLSHRPRTFGVTTRHVRQIELRVSPLDDDTAVDLLTRNAMRDRWPASLKPITKTLTLEPKGSTDFAEIAVDLRDFVGERKGAFAVEVRALQAVPAAAGHELPDPVRGLFRVTNMGTAAVTSTPRNFARVVDLQTGAPIPGAKARYVQKHGSTAELGTTDANGVVNFGPQATCPSSPQPGATPTKTTTTTTTTTTAKAKKTTSAGCVVDVYGRGSMKLDQPTQREGMLVIDGPDEDRAYLELKADATKPVSGLRPGERLLGRVITERGVYRPGETIHVLGWSAIATPFSRSNLRRPKRTSVLFKLADSRGDTILEARGKTTAEGKLTASLELPQSAPLGRYTVTAELLGSTLSESLKVEDFRTPEFEVGARAVHPDVIADDGQTVHVNANYYFGGAVDLNTVRFTDRCSTFLYRPPGVDPAWRFGAYPSAHYGRTSGPQIVANRLSPPPKGDRDLELKTLSRFEGQAERCTVSVSVRDASLQAIGAEDTYTVHPASFYLGIKTPKGATYVGDRYPVPIRAVHYDGHRVAADDVQIEITRTFDVPRYRKEDGKRVLYGHESKTETVKTCALSTPAAGDDAICDPGVLKIGGYNVRATATQGSHKTLSETSFWIRERPKHARAWSWPKPSRLEIRTSSSEVVPGDTVSVFIQSPWEIDSGVLAIERAGLREQMPIKFEDKRATIELKADDTWTPGIFLEAIAVRPVKHYLPQIVHAKTSIKQNSDHRQLTVAVDAPSEAGPGDSIQVKVHVEDAAGQPSAGRIALWAVDEAVLSLTSYEVPDLLPSFIVRPERATHLADDFSTLTHPFSPVDSDPWLDIFTGGSIGGGGFGSGYGSGSSSGFGGRGSRAAPAPARSRFSTTPAFFADLAVGPSGERSATIELPDNLTTFRILAVASSRLVDGQSPGRVGVGDSRIRVTKPLILRPALPRIMRPGDRSEVAAIVQNRTSRPGTIEVTIALKGGSPAPLTLLSEKSVTAPIAADGQVRIPFTIQATRPGETKIELRATFVDDRKTRRDDAVELPLEIAPERTLIERVATYGTVDDDSPIAVPLRMPSAVLPDFGGVTVSTTSTLLGGVEDAVHGLLYYPYGCVEQTASRLLPLIAIADLRSLIPETVDVDTMVATGVDRLLSMQLAGGGFSYWPGGTQPVPYASAYATWVLQRAAHAGFPVPPAALERALDYVETIVDARNISTSRGYGHITDVRRVLAVHTLTSAGRKATAAIKDLYTRRADLPAFARGFLLMAIHSRDSADPRVPELSAELLGNLKETEATAHTMEALGYDLSGVFHSDGRSDAIVLSALLQTKRTHPVLPKLARGLLERRLGGSWRNTQENAYAILALTDYARVYEKDVPDFVARAWVGQLQILDAVFRGRDPSPQDGEVKMAPLLAGLADPTAPTGPSDLLNIILERKGQGRLYYRIGAQWAPVGLDLPAQSRGLSIRRTLRNSEGAIAQGQALLPGETVAMDIVVGAENRVPYIAVDVPIPAGLEAVQRSLGKGQAAVTLRGRRGWWVDHEEQRRDRVVIFADDLQPGDHHHTVNLRATTPGSYTMPPATAEAMYAPEIYGRSTPTQVTVASP